MRKYNYSVISKNLFDIDWPTEHATIAIVGISTGPSQFKAQTEEPDLIHKND